MTFTQEEVQALCYSPYWYNLSMDQKIVLQCVLEEYIEMKDDEDLSDIEDVKDLLETIENPIFKKYKDVIHCGVSD